MTRNKLTQFIFIALIAGIIVGYLYNTKIVGANNQKITAADITLRAVDTKIAATKDTTTTVFKQLKAGRFAQAGIKKDNEGMRDDRLEGYSLLSDMFLRLIKMIVGLLVFTTLTVGVAKVGDIAAVGRIGGKTMLWFLSATLVSLLLGMLLINVFKPGVAMHLPLPDSHLSTDIKKNGLSLRDFEEHLIPRSFAEAMSQNNILQIVVFALFFGVATASVGEKGEIVIKFLDATAHIIMKITGYVMKLAPIAVFGAITVVVAKQGIGILSTYAIFIGEFYFSLLLLWLIIVLAGFVVLKKRVFLLVNGIKDAMLIAFSTSTSEAAYPRVLMELERFGCSDKITSFVLPLGYSFNLDGSMMYMTFASLFLAQAYGVHLALPQQFLMLLILMLTSKGVAGVPRAALVVVASIIGNFNIPEAGLALLIGIDPILDMGRSATNVLGNAMATAVVSKWEGRAGGSF